MDFISCYYIICWGWKCHSAETPFLPIAPFRSVPSISNGYLRSTLQDNLGAYVDSFTMLHQQE